MQTFVDKCFNGLLGDRIGPGLRNGMGTLAVAWHFRGFWILPSNLVISSLHWLVFVEFLGSSTAYKYIITLGFTRSSYRIYIHDQFGGYSSE